MKYLLVLFLVSSSVTVTLSVLISQLNDGYIRNLKTSSIPQAFLHQNGVFYSVSGNLLRVNDTFRSFGQDSIGRYVANNIQFLTVGDSQNTAMEVEERVYSMDSQFGAEVTIYSQRFPQRVESTSTNQRNWLISGYPCIDYSQETKQVGFWSLGGYHFGWMKQRFGLWTQPVDMVRIADGLQSGPLILLHKEWKSTEIITRFENFMTTHANYRALGAKQVCWGIMGNVSHIDEGYSVSFIKVRVPGVLSGRVAFEKWGEIMTSYYGKTQAAMKDDLSVNYLGYYTDNGAYYYYLTENKSVTYEDTVYDVINHSYEQKIPYKYFQYDSWFYPKDNISNAVTQWVGTEKTFPKNLTWSFQRNMWPIVAHNRYFSAETVYATQNGGAFQFEVEEKISVPVDPNFWHFLFQQSKLWGLATYEQDWHNVILEDSIATTSTLNVASDWLMHMGRAASQLGLHIQYCMALPKSALQSLLIPSVSHARVSDDYQPGNDQWRIGLTSIFAWALNLAPFKDTFWSSGTQPGNRYGKEEPYPVMHSLVSTLSGGPVAPGDKIGYEDKNLIMRSVNEDGLILRASRPAFAIDKQLLQMTSLIDDGPTGEVWTTHSTIGPFVHATVFAVLNKSTDSYLMSVDELGFKIAPSNYLYEPVPSGVTLRGILDGTSGTVSLRNCTKKDFCLLHTSPGISLLDDTGEQYATIYILGDVSKWIPMSPDRVSGIEVNSKEVRVSLSGAPSESVSMTFLYTDDTGTQLTSLTCRMDSSGLMIMHYPANKCFGQSGKRLQNLKKVEKTYR